MLEWCNNKATQQKHYVCIADLNAHSFSPFSASRILNCNCQLALIDRHVSFVLQLLYDFGDLSTELFGLLQDSGLSVRIWCTISCYSMHTMLPSVLRVDLCCLLRITCVHSRLSVISVPYLIRDLITTYDLVGDEVWTSYNAT